MPLDKIRAPYGFVPLASQVVYPDWSDRASQDWPLEDGLRGRIDVEIEAHSPIFVRDPTDRTRFFQAPDGRHGIPGSSLRGMLRNVVEIASFGKLNRFDRRRYGVRDLHNRDVYGSHMAEVLPTVAGKGEPMPLVNAGWLVPVDDADPDDETAVVARIEPCHFAKIEYGKVREIARGLKIGRFDPGLRQSAADKYRAWRNPDGKPLPRRFGFKINALRPPGRDRRLVSEFGQVAGPGHTEATLVFTGQPSRYDPHNLNRRRGAGNPKHHDFVFYGSAGGAYDVTRQAFRDFEFVHSASGERHQLTGRIEPNDEWRFWQSKAAWDDAGASRRKRRVPVFFLADERGLRAFGLAMMFRLAYRYGVEDAVRNGQPDFDTPRLDLAETLFGRVRKDRGQGSDEPEALKGRVAIGFAAVQGEAQPMSEVALVLSTPKASYYPNYVEQQPEVGHGQPPRKEGGKLRYATYMDQGVRIRGWKRYRPIEGHAVLRPAMPTKGDGGAMDTSTIETRFRPLPAGTRFRSTLRLHNVRPVEVGALLWAIELGGEDEAFHKIGLARPMGYGTVSLCVAGDALRDNDDRFVDLAQCRQAFADYMSAQVPGWAESAQIREFLALARPMAKADARHMLINHPQHRNEFAAAKQEGLALAAATEAPLKAGATPSPRLAQRAGQGRAQGGSTEPGNGPWKPLPAGQRLEVLLTGTNKKGKWRFRVVGHEAAGTVVQGEPPADAAEGQRLTVQVVRGATRSSIEAGWEDA